MACYKYCYINDRQGISFKDGNNFIITVKDMTNTYDICEGDAYNYLKRGVENLVDRIATFRNGVTIKWVSESRYIDNKG